MGNSNPKYLTEREALAVLGEDIWGRLSTQLDSLGGAVDFGSFYRIVLQKFRIIPKYSCECLYRGFASDIHAVLEVSDFICALAVVRAMNSTLLLSFAFRVYDSSGNGEVTKKQLAKQLNLAYGANLSQYNAEFDLDTLFENTSTENIINAREFETYKGASRVFTEWISAVLSSFLDPPPARLEALEIKYSTTREADQMMIQYNIPKALCNKLYRMFSSLCQNAGRPEMDLKTWLKLATKYVHPALAFEIFRAKLHDVKVAWRFVDFFEFCYLFGLFLPNMSEADAEVHSSTTFSTVERQAAALCTIFQLAAERDADEADGSVDSLGDSAGRGYTTSLLNVKVDQTSSSGSGKQSTSSKKIVLYMRRLIYLMSMSSSSKVAINTSAKGTDHEDKEDVIGKIVRRVSVDPAHKNSYAYAAATASVPDATPQFDVFKLSPLDTMPSSELDKLSCLSEADAATGMSVISPVVIKALLELESSCKTEPTLKEYVGFLCGFEHFLPGFQQLSMLACCTFGVKPLLPELEKLYIIDLTLSRQDDFPQTKQFPNGPVGTKWSVLSSSWLNSWRFFVGRQRRGSVHLSDSAIKDQLAKEDILIDPFRNKKGRRKSGGGGPSPIIKNVVNAVLPLSLFSSVLKPFAGTDNHSSADEMSGHSTDTNGDPTEIPPIDNFSIVRKRPALATIAAVDSKQSGSYRYSDDTPSELLVTTTAPILIPGLNITQQLELVPPDVYKTLFLWYGGGPEITRSVVLNELKKPELELYPLCVRVCRCDPNGNPSVDEREFTFSKMASVGDVIKSICSYYRCPDGSAKLWDYYTSDWKTQKLLSDTSISLFASGIADGQLLLLEISLGDGTWPRSQRQSELEAEMNNKNEGKLSKSTSLTSLVSASKISAGGGLLARSRFPNAYNGIQSPAPRTPLNKGRVGIDNLGNTCYMSSSLQVLLHTDQLVEYFMRKSYLKHVNIHSRHGYKGRLAHAFGKLVSDLWCTDMSSVSPRNFRQELAQIREQFSGNEQHDAQELMVFLLDGLSEDVNLVHEKPYSENPDSDGRSDEELANIWWANHLKRENSVIQALFTGQFKSVMRCANCQHHSARFEPFTSLSIPLLENHTQSVYVDVVTLGCKYRVQKCVVLVQRTDTLSTVVDIITDAEFGILGLSCATPSFLAVDTFDSRVREFHPFTRQVSNIMSNETIALYEVTRPYIAPQNEVVAENAVSKKLKKFDNNAAVSATNTSQVEGDCDMIENDADVVPTSSVPRDAMEVDNSPLPSPTAAATDDVVEQDISDAAQSDGIARVVILQRRARYVAGGGISNFILDPIGVPIVDVVDKCIAASDLYALVSEKLKHCLKAPLDVLLSGSKLRGSNRHGVKGGLGTSSEASFSSNKSIPRANKNTASTGSSVQKNSSDYSLSDLKTYYDLSSDAVESGGNGSDRSSFDASPPSIRPVEIEEAVAKDISTYGFVLRYIRPDGVSCSKCPWIHGCQGCLVPDSPDLMLNLDDGTVFAADWHYVVYYELIESAGAHRGNILHPSMDKERNERNVPKIALSSCLDKFMEEEKLDGTVCPKCHEDSHLSKNFILWRLPPVLFVQLKRFQFDRYSRRKLNDLVDFPLENLDLAPYLAAGSPHVPRDNNSSGDEDLHEESINCSCMGGEGLGSGAEHVCSQYSLYAVVHHLGIMGGGHYVASVRDNSASMEVLHENAAIAAANQVESLPEGGVLEDGDTQKQTSSTNKNTPLSRQWWCYNDSTVTPIKEEDVVAPSAYLLFYMRNDIARGTHKLEDIFKYAEAMDEEVLMDQVETPEGEENTATATPYNDSNHHNRGAKYEVGDDVSTRRGVRDNNGKHSDEGSISDGKVDGDQEATTATVSAGGRKRTHDGKINESGREDVNKPFAGDAPSAKKKQQVGYTEEEFEKIMQNNSDTQQCSIS